MGWQTTITKQGLAVLAGLDDNRIRIVSAQSGSGIVDPNLLQEQTALFSPKQELPIVEDGKLGNKRILRLQVSNEELLNGYTLNQLGVFISVDGGEPILYFIAQNESGDVIPAKEAVTGFLAEYITSLVFSMRSDVVVDTGQTAYVTTDALDAKISLLMGIVPIDGGTFFEEYDLFTADGGEF